MKMSEMMTRMRRRRITCAMAALVALTCTVISAFAALPEDDAKKLQQAQQLYESKSYAQATTLLRQLREAHPDLGDVHRLLGHCYYELGRVDEARQSLIESITRGRATQDVLARLVQIDREADRPLAELGSLRMLMLIDPDNKQTHMLYADALARAGADDEAIGAFNLIVEADPLNVDARLRLGNLYMQQGERRRAATAYQTAYHLGAASSQLAHTIGELWFSFGDAREALAWYERAVELSEPTDPRRQLRRAELLVEIGDYKRAEELAKGVSSGDDEELARRALVLLGRVAHLCEKPDEAVSRWTRAIDKGADDAQVLAYIGGHHFNVKNYDEAAKYLAKRIDAGESNPSLHRFLIISLIRSGKHEAAYQELKGYVARYGLDEIAEDLIRQLKASRAGTSAD